MALRRKLLGLAAVASLSVLVYGGISFAFSQVIDPETAKLNHVMVAEGAPVRVILVPVPDLRTLPTFAGMGPERAGHPGALFAYGKPEGSFPVSATEVKIARALVHVPAANESQRVGTITLEAVPMPGGPANLTFDVDALAQGRAGFVAKFDLSTEPFFVPEEAFVGQAARFERVADAWLLTVGGAIGFVGPVFILIFTHKGAGARGTSMSLCRECRAPLTPGDPFCTKCGALKPGGEDHG